jgi:hypothetical protein
LQVPLWASQRSQSWSTRALQPSVAPWPLSCLPEKFSVQMCTFG